MTDAPEPTDALLAAARLRAFIRGVAPGQCKMLSQGDACTCPLCDVDALERRLAAPLPEEVREAIAYVRTRKMLHADEGDASVIDLLESMARQLAEAQADRDDCRKRLDEAQEQARRYQAALKEALDSVANMERELGEARQWHGPVADGG